MTTKEQERQAIEKIRKIVEGLGENSYVGFAMEGVLELAEDNIREDTAYSMKKNAEIAWERADKAEKESKLLNLRYAKRSEDTEQINVTSWAAWNERQYPELKWLHHIPNGGSRNKAEAVKLKQMGVKAGVSDLCLPYPKGIYCGLYIEMKFGDGKHQKSQKEFLTDMAAVGHYVATCYTSEDAVNVLREYCELLSPQWMKEPNNSVWKEGTISPLKKK